MANYVYESLGARSKRYAQELKLRTNTLTGEKLNDKTACFRMGVLNERKKASKIYNYKKNKGK